MTRFDLTEPVRLLFKHLHTMRAADKAFKNALAYRFPKSLSFNLTFGRLETSLIQLAHLHQQGDKVQIVRRNEDLNRVMSWHAESETFYVTCLTLNIMN